MPHGRDQFLATVRANIPLCREHFRLVLSVAQFPETFPGHFIQIGCRDMEQNYSPEREFTWEPGQTRDVDGAELLSPLAMLRRPFSLAGRRGLSDAVELDIIHRVVGVGTEWLAKLTAGQHVDILGPLGNTFTLPTLARSGLSRASSSGRPEGPPVRTALLVGGGVGIPPMLYLASQLKSPAIAFSGALTRDLLPFTLTGNSTDPTTPANTIAEFTKHNIPSVITTDDGSHGFQGYVTQALEKYLDSTGRTDFIIYTCGPEPMMKRVADIAMRRNIECQIAVERAMACGMGTCQSCCIKVLKPDPSKPPLPGKNWCYRLACTDGPVFKATELLW